MKLVAQSVERLFLDRVSLISKIFVGSNPMRGSRNLTRERLNFNHCAMARKMAKSSRIPRIVNEIPGNLRANSQEKAVKLERKWLRAVGWLFSRLEKHKSHK